MKRALAYVAGLWTIIAAGVLFYFESPAIKCKKAYGLLTQDGVMAVTVAFGYKDARPARFVGDRYERAAFVDLLSSPCDGNDPLCGFKMDAGNPEFFGKKLKWLDKQDLTVKIQVLSSSIGPDDEWNRGAKAQDWNSERTRRLFRRAIAKSDIVFYNGHSRTGGGPDFFFPRIFHDTGRVDYGYYQQEQPGLKDLLSDLAAAKGGRQPRLLGLFSCASSQHFVKAILDAKPKLGVISSEALLYYGDAMENMVSALRSILRGECANEMNEHLRSHDPLRGSNIKGFF